MARDGWGKPLNFLPDARIVPLIYGQGSVQAVNFKNLMKV